MNTRNKILLYCLVLGSLLLAPAVPQFNVLVCAAVAVYIVIRQRLDLFPLLILTNIPISSFFFGGGADYGTFEYMVETYETAYINIAGLPISAGLVTVVVMAFVCYANFLKTPQRFYPGALKVMFILWNIGALFAVLIALNGILQHHQAWSGPLRAYLSTIGIFYGYGVALNSPHLKGPLFIDFLVFFLVIGLAAVLGVFHHRILFLGAGFVPGLAFIALRRRDFFSRVLGVANLVVWALYALAGFSRGGETTFTVIALFCLGSILGFSTMLRSKLLIRSIGKALAYPAIIVIFAYMAFSIYGSKKYSIASYVQSGAEVTMLESLKYKIFDDRARLWGFVLDDIKRDNKILPIPGEDLMVIHPNRGALYVRYGAHNSFLQALRENGVISGGIIIILMLFTLVRSAQAYGGLVAGVTGAIAIGSIVTLTVGAVTGHYVIGQTIGAFVFMLGGMAMAGDAGDFYSVRKDTPSAPFLRPKPGYPGLQR
jgi:hypothetical protein